MIKPSKADAINGGALPDAGSKSAFLPCSFLRFVLYLTAFALLCLGLSGPIASASANPKWSSIPSGWSGTGSVFVPKTGHIGSSSSATCSGCEWKMEPICSSTSTDRCEVLPPYLPCGPDEVRFGVYFGSNGQPMKFLDAPCLGPRHRPVSSTELESRLDSAIRESVPALWFEYQPPTGALTQLPTAFRVEQPSEIHRSDDIAGFQVRFQAKASWVWKWGDGRSLNASQPGGKWPDLSISHTYRKPGVKTVALRTNWAGSYSVDGGEWIQVADEPVSQKISRNVRVREARAELVE